MILAIILCFCYHNSNDEAFDLEAVMNNDIMSVLQTKAHTFSNGQRLIARYITEAYDKAAFMTASRLGKTVGVSESTVVGFCVGALCAPVEAR